MPLLDIATAQPCFRNSLHTFRSQSILINNFVCQNEKRLGFPWRYFSFPSKANNFNMGRIELWSGRLIIKAVATLEPAKLTHRDTDFKLLFDVDSASSGVSGDGNQSLGEEVNYREKLRRMRISKANKGNTPWNKGKKHSPETLKRIKERTRLAMQDPKVKMKLVNLGHAQSEETRTKIAAGVRIGWEKRREKLMVQETCLYEWQNLIAEASRKGVLGKEELQWDSYKIMAEQLDLEWVESVEERKRMPRLKGSKRAPKPLEQRRKISAAIAAKWSDPAYRSRVYSGLAKYHGIKEVTVRKPRPKPSGDGHATKKSPKMNVDSDDPPKLKLQGQIQQTRFRKKTIPVYKDPLADSKLEMLKNIRAQRAVAECNKTEAISRAKVLITEAEKAAKALEAAAKNSPIAQASLIETRKLIAEAVQSIISIEEGQVDTKEDGSTSMVSVDRCFEDETVTGIEELDHRVVEDLNGAKKDFNFKNSSLRDLLDKEDQVSKSSLNGFNLVNGRDHKNRHGDHDLLRLMLDDKVKLSSLANQLAKPELNGMEELTNGCGMNGAKFLSKKEDSALEPVMVAKKWVRGRLVEVSE